jgi:hypothetical protein
MYKLPLSKNDATVGVEIRGISSDDKLGETLAIGWVPLFLSP